MNTNDRHADKIAIELLIWGAMLFNWGLAFVNAHVMSVSQLHVVFCEIVLLALALALMWLQGLRRDQLFILCALAVYLAFTALRFAYAQEVEPKPIRDVAIIFVFLCLGMSYRTEPYRLVYWAGLLIAAIGLVEIVLPEFYGAIFNVKSYYINTRGFTEADFWNPNSDLFISGTRPGSRFFLAFTNWPRASSVFLEPVSLGNFIIVSMCALLAGWRTLTPLTKLTWSLVLIVLLLISDSRFAFACSLIVIAAAVVLRRIPQQFSFLLFGGVIVAGDFLVWITGKATTSDDFLGRLFYTFNALQRLDFGMLIGIRYELAPKFMDSGLAYFIVSQSLLCVIAFPVLYSIGVVGTTREARLYKHCVMIMLALGLLISNSLFSIKIAALLWFSLGAFVSARVGDDTPLREDMRLRTPGYLGY